MSPDQIAIPADSSGSPALSATDFDFERGDVKIKVTIDGKIITGRVCSHAMALASPVLKKFVFLPWDRLLNANCTASADSQVNAIHRENSVQEVDFSEDNCDALLIILRIIHLDLHRIPKELNDNLLFQLAVLTDHYQCIKLVHPFLDNWLPTIEDSGVEETPGLQKEAWLFVFWTFGRQENFSKLAKQLVTECRATKGIQYLTARGEELTVTTPPEIIEAIAVERSRVLDDILEIPYNLVRKFTGISLDRPPRFRGICHDEGCDAMIYGSLLFSLQDAGLWPKEKARNIYRNLGEAAKSVEELKVPDCFESS